jgi:glycosyltransferase involved in cell wall biosynthesis
MDAHDSKYRHALELVADGRHEEALHALQEHLLGHPADGEALNDAGALLYGLGRLDEAIRHLEMALTQLPHRPAKTLANLAEAYLAAERPAEALGLFDELAAAAALTSDLANRTATALLQHNDRAGAMEALLRCLHLAAPQQQEDLLPLVAKLRSLRANVGIFPRGGEGTRPGRQMLRSLRRHLEPRFPTRLYRGSGEDDLGPFLRWCDIAWFEGCGPEALLATRLPKTCRIVIHIHPHEAYDPALEQVHWAHADVLVTSGSRRVRDFLARRLSDFGRCGRIEHLPPGVDFEQLPAADPRPGKNLACVGDLDPRHNPMFLVQCFRRLHGIDPQFRLSFAGYFHDDALEAYLTDLLGELDLTEAVSFDGWQEDLPAYLADKQYIVSAGILEAHDASVLEAMGMGLQPVIHWFPGAADLYPAEALYRTDEEFCRRILDDALDPQACRRFVREHFGIEAFLARAGGLLVALEDGLLRRQVPQTPGAGEGAGSPGGCDSSSQQAADAANEAR